MERNLAVSAGMLAEWASAHLASDRGEPSSHSPAPEVGVELVAEVWHWLHEIYGLDWAG